MIKQQIQRGWIIEFDFDPSEVALTVEHVCADITQLKLSSEKRLGIQFTMLQPLVDVAGRWQPSGGADRNLPISWERERSKQVSSAGQWAPVTALVSMDDHNRGCFALSEVTERVELICGVVEDLACVRWRIGCTLGDQPLQVRFDSRALPLHKVLADVVNWWDLPDVAGPPASPPSSAGCVPVYSTWYAYRQSVTPEAVEEECHLASALGIGAIIVDDGWQQDDVYDDMQCTGTWEPTRFSGTQAMRRHVDGIKQHGIAYMVWMAIPFLGYADPQLSSFEERGWVLAHQERIRAAVVDPRYPEVRSWIVNHIERVVETHGLDGIKLDFIDRFTTVWDGTMDASNGRDTASVPDGVSRLVRKIGERLHGRWPGLPVEFRQRYIGPVPRLAGNLLRATDCPSDYVENRRRTVDTRLLAGHAVTHADMVTWHADDPPASAAMQLISIFHAVPQISVRLAHLSDEHRRMLAFWLQLWNRYKHTIITGTFQPHGHLASWNHIICHDESCRIDILHAPLVCTLGDCCPSTLVLINGSGRDEMFCYCQEDQGGYDVQILDCMGQVLLQTEMFMTAGVHHLLVPRSGVAICKAISECASP